MRALTLEGEPVAVDIVFYADSFRVTIDDGRELSVPLAWFPRLLRGTPEQRDQWELIGRGEDFTGKRWMKIYPLPASLPVVATGAVPGRRRPCGGR